MRHYVSRFNVSNNYNMSIAQTKYNLLILLYNPYHWQFLQLLVLAHEVKKILIKNTLDERDTKSVYEDKGALFRADAIV